MFSSVNENNVGFSAVGQEELEKVNGGWWELAVVAVGAVALIIQWDNRRRGRK